MSWQTPSARKILRMQPFRGLRYGPRVDALAEVTFVPPTAWSRMPEDLLSRLDPHHIMQLLTPAFGGDPVAGARRAHELLTAWLSDGTLVRDDAPALYVYAQSTGEHDVIGVVAAVDLMAHAEGPFLDHEEVIDELVAVQERLEHTTSAQIEPILALHRNAPALGEALTSITTNEADIDIDSGGVRHRLWRVSDDEAQREIAGAVPDEPALIADGHHRHAAWRRLATGDEHGPGSAALALLVDAGQQGLHLGAIHRVISGLDIADALATSALTAQRLEGRTAAVAYLADGPTAGCVLYADGVYYAAQSAGPSADCAAPELAVCHLHSSWLDTWGVGEAAISYVHRLDEAIDLAGDEGVAVLLPVATLDEVFTAARSGQLMPRKATSFGPKPLVGTVFRHW